MALTGTLKDLGIIDLIQFPHSGRKTGMLVVRGEKGEARLFYQNGKLVDAGWQDLTGLDVLIELVDWTEGGFEFRLNVEAPAQSIELELHRAIMYALKARDERAQLAEAEAEAHKVDPREHWQRVLSEFITKAGYARHVCLLSATGEVLAEADHPKGAPDDVPALRESILAFTSGYPRRELRRIMLEEQDGTVVVHLGEEGRCLITIAGQSAATGAVARAVSKLASLLESEGAS